MPAVLFISGFMLDRRVWADIPELVPREFVAEFYDQKSPENFISDSDLADSARLVPENGRFAVVVSSGNGSSTAVSLALRGQAGALLLLEPMPDSRLAEVPFPDFSGQEEQMARYAALVSAAQEGADEQTWRGLVHDIILGTLAEALSSRDRELVEAIAMDHADDFYDVIREGVAGAWSAPHPPEAERWVGRLSEVTVPVVIMSDEFQTQIARALADRLPHGRAVLPETPGSPVWLTNRQQTTGLLTSLLPG